MANTPIIPGVPTPASGDPKCALTLCGRIIAQVDCIKVIMQGTSACIDIQFFGKDSKPLDLARFTEIQIMLYNEFDCTVANFWYPDVPTGCKGFTMTILQYTDAKGRIHNEGLVRICLDSACTKISPTAISAEILLTELTTAGTAETFGISCLQVARIAPSKIYENGCDDGCYPGYVPGGGGSSGGGGSTGGAGAQGATGVQGLTGATGLGSTGATGIQGPTGTQGPTGLGSTGATGTQGEIGATGLGLTGATGIGSTGATGVQGPQGPQGSTGLGSTGATGVQGPQGSQGATGFTGSTGATGVQGPQGATGFVSGSVAYSEIHDAFNPASTLNLTPTFIGWNTGAFGETNQVTNVSGAGPVGDKFKIIESGVYQFVGSFAIESDTNNSEITAAIFVNGVEVVLTTTTRSFGSNNTTGSFTITDLLDLNTNDEVEVKFKADQSLTMKIVNVSTNIVKCIGIGLQGATGEIGPQGTTGATGSQGTTGATGSQGAIGSQGTTGATGTQGEIGATGSQGAIGSQGTTGATGSTGFNGATGFTGSTGFNGATGAIGSTGFNGATGTQGEIGATGSDADTLVTTNTQAGSYTLVLGDRNKIVELNSPVGISPLMTLTVPPNSSVAFPIGSQIMVARGNTGKVQISEGTGVTIISSNNNTFLQYQYSGGTLVKKDTNEWWLFGDLSAS